MVKSWIPGLHSTKQQLRNLRNKAKHIIDSNDPEIISVGDRVIRAVCDEPQPEYSALHLFCAAIDISEESGWPWIVCMTHIMDKFDHEAGRTTDAQTTQGDPSASRLRGLL